MREKVQKVVEIQFAGEGFYEQVQTDEGMKYAFYHPPVGLRKQETWSLDGTNLGEQTEDYRIVYRPVDPCPWSPPREPRKPDPGLWEAVRCFVEAHVDFIDVRLYHVVTAWIYSTWIPEAFTAVPYLHLLGPKKSGKTRLLEVLKALSYRGILTHSMTEATIFRTIQKHHPTLLIDEAEIYNFKDKSAVQNLLNAGYRRGLLVPRAEPGPNGEWNIRWFPVFGHKAIAATMGFRDTLESRSIRLNMEKNVRQVNLFVDEEAARELRSQLLVWRWRRLRDLSDNSDESDRYSGGEGPPQELAFAYMDGRFVELWAPLLKVANHGEEQILSYAREAYEDMVEEEKSTIEALFLKAVLNSYTYLESGKIPVSVTKEAYNSELSDKEQKSPQWIGRMFKKLGFRPARLTGGARAYQWNQPKIDRLCKRYGVPPIDLSLPSLSSLEEPSPGEEMAKFATRYLKRQGGSVGTTLFYNTMNERGYHPQDVDAVLGPDPRFEFTSTTVNLRARTAQDRPQKPMEKYTTHPTGNISTTSKSSEMSGETP